MRTLSLSLLLVGAAAVSSVVATELAPERSVQAMLSSQTDQVNDVKPNRGGGRRHRDDSFKQVAKAWMYQSTEQAAPLYH